MKMPDVFDNSKRYLVTNWTDRDFETEFEKQKYPLPAGTATDYPEYLAYHITRHLVNREMIKAGKEATLYDDNARKEYEDKTMAALNANEDSPALKILKEQMRAQIMDEMKSGDVSLEKQTTGAEFEALNKKK